MATKIASNFTSNWPAVANETLLWNVAGSPNSNAALEAGDVCTVTSAGRLYVCVVATVGAAVWRCADDSAVQVSNWTEYGPAIAQDFADAANASTDGVLFAGAESGVLYRSAIGDTWAAVTSNTTNYIRHLAYSSSLDRFVGACDGGEVIYHDGTAATAWTLQNAATTTITGTNTPVGLEFGASLFVAAHLPSGGSTEVWTSATGIGAWTEQTIPVLGDAKALAFDGTRFVLITDDGEAIRSTDGTSWTSSAIVGSPTGIFQAVAKGDVWRIVTTDGELLSSTDAATFTVDTTASANLAAVLLPLVSASIEMAYANGMWVVATTGSNTIPRVALSRDGVVWRRRTGFELRTIGAVEGIHYNAFLDRWLILGRDGHIWASLHGGF